MKKPTDFEKVKQVFDEVGVEYIGNENFPCGNPLTITLLESIINADPDFKKDPLHLLFNKSGKYIEVV